MKSCWEITHNELEELRPPFVAYLHQLILVRMCKHAKRTDPDLGVLGQFVKRQPILIY
jgi:hypothetical protein